MKDDDENYDENSEGFGHDDEKDDEEYLKQYISGEELNADNNERQSEPREEQPKYKSNMKVSDMEYENIPLYELPCGDFYPDGLKILVRAAKVTEIQAYSVVDDKNIYDITEKMNDMLKTCVKVILPNGTQGSYFDVKDADRVYLIFYIKERTFQSGNNLKLDCECEACGHEFGVNMERKYFIKGEMPEDLAPYFDSTTKMFHFDLINADSIKIGLPTIGIQKQFYEYIKDTVKDEKTPNMAYLKTDPFLIPNRSKITSEGIKKRVADFKRMDPDTYQFINGAINKIDEAFGIKEIISKCPECSEEVHSRMKFPGGASTIFVIPDVFDKFIKK